MGNPDPGAPAPDDSTYSVAELNQAIAGSVVDAFPRPVWVRGEIQQLTKSRNGHTYFELVEKAESRDRVRAVLRIVLFRDARAAVNRTLREVPGIKVTDGVEVRIQGRVDFYPASGRLQLVMSAIDPVFTVGKLAADRERVLRTLAAEGVLRRNGELELAHRPRHEWRECCVPRLPARAGGVGPCLPGRARRRSGARRRVAATDRLGAASLGWTRR